MANYSESSHANESRIESEHQLIHTDSEDFIAVNIYEGMANDKVQKKKSVRFFLNDKE